MCAYFSRIKPLLGLALVRGCSNLAARGILILMLTGTVASAQLVDVSNVLNLQTEHFGGYLGAGVSFADFNGDFIDDLSFADFEGNLYFFAGTGEGFESVDLALPDYPQEAKMILWGDIDNDGDQDLLVTYRLAANRLYLNNGDDSFTDISLTSGINQSNRKSFGACFGDYDKDGLLDLYITNYTGEIDPAPYNELYHNLGGGIFEDVTFDSDVGQLGLQSFQGMWVDFNEDDLLDLHVIRDRTVFDNLYYEQQADNSINPFLEVGQSMGLDLMINCMSGTVADFDHDGDQDVYLTAFDTDGNWLMVNDGGVFDIVNLVTMTIPNDSVQVDAICWAANWLDIDNNGWEDLHVTTGYSDYTDYPGILDVYPDEPDRLFYNTAGGFTDAAESFSNDNILSFATVAGDFNYDGFPDLVSHRVGEFAQVLQSTPNDHHWLKLWLQGTESNRDGVGAKIHLWNQGNLQYHMHFAGENYLGQNSSWEHFGLAELTEVDSIIIAWPSGIFNKLYDISADQHLVVIEGGDFEALWSDSCLDECLGCTYPLACNFDADANLDDGSCDFSCFEGPESCGPGTVWNASLGQCQSTNEINLCPTDINGDGIVNIYDLLELLSAFSFSCPE